MYDILCYMDAWYRKQTWTKKNEQDFFRHWVKCRTAFNKAQYLKLQAYELYDAHNKKNFNGILSLLDKYFNDFPDDRFFRGACLHLYGRVYYDKKNYDKALFYYRKAAYQESEYAQVISGAWIDYARIILLRNSTDLYDEAEKFVLSQYNSLLFPIEIYKANAILAIVRYSRGDYENAGKYKSLACEAVLAKEPILKNLGKIGLVTQKDKFLERAMRKIRT